MRPLPCVSIVIPAHNEAASIRHTIEQLDQAFADQLLDAEIIVVDDGSIDDTSDQLALTSTIGSLVTVSGERCRGKGHAIRRGMSLARGRAVICTDADLPIDTGSVVSCAWMVLLGETDVCIGDRFHRESHRTGRSSWSRWLASVVYRQWSRILVPAVSKVSSDPACCLKAFSASTTREVLACSGIEGYAFDVEALAIVAQDGTAIVSQIPVDWTDKRSRLPLSRLVRLGIACTSDLLLVRTGRRAGCSYLERAPANQTVA
jgi:dolichyl-phosphate beta-glucosyltransferase